MDEDYRQKEASTWRNMTSGLKERAVEAIPLPSPKQWLALQNEETPSRSQVLVPYGTSSTTGYMPHVRSAGLLQSTSLQDF